MLIGASTAAALICVVECITKVGSLMLGCVFDLFSNHFLEANPGNEKVHKNPCYFDNPSHHVFPGDMGCFSILKLSISYIKVPCYRTSINPFSLIIPALSSSQLVVI